MPILPPHILAHLEPFRIVFLTKKMYLRASLLLIGAIMCRGGRTICSILRVLGMQGETTFSKYHNVLNRSKWDTLRAGKILLEQLDSDKNKPLRIVIDGHLERRRGRSISAKGHYRDPVQSGDNCTVISSGLKWLSVMVIKDISWFHRIVALPFLSVLVPSEKANKEKGKKHKTLQRWTCQIIMQIRRWFPKRKIIATADGEFAVAEIAKIGSKHKISLVSRLKLNARLFDFPFVLEGRGRPRKKGKRLPKAEEMLKDPNLRWESGSVRWYGESIRNIHYVTGICLWHVMGNEPLLIRYVLLKDPLDKFNPILLMSIDTTLDAIQIVEIYVSRWSIEVTFKESREHLGIETQRQWSDLAIKRSTPIIFALYSLIMLIGEKLHSENLIQVDKRAWYQKDKIKFSDVISAVRKYIFKEVYFCKGGLWNQTIQKSNDQILDNVVNLFAVAV